MWLPKLAKLSLLFFLASCAVVPPTEELRVSYERTAIDFSSDDMANAATSLMRSCAVLVKKGTGAPLKTNASVWQKPCAALRNSDDVGTVLQKEFTPWRVVTTPPSGGLFTGYYEPTLDASRTKHGDYTVPLYARPADLVEVNLGDFRPALKGQRIAGSVKDGKLIPYADRAAIEAGSLRGKNLELFYARDAAAVFFLQIQGSGRLMLDDGTQVRIGYAAQNGHAYAAIGKELVAMGEMEAKNTSLQTIRAWLAKHPEKAQGLMNKNPSFVFFRVLNTGAVGSTGVELVPERSLAVDPKFIAYHLPLWLETTLPNGEPYNRVIVAQDTGGAITGAVRGDVFFGAGARAEALAGEMKQAGAYYVLLPKGVDANAAQAQ